MQASKRSDDFPSVAAASLLAMCVVTFSHEALGHAGTCLTLGRHVVLLSSSLFECDPASGLVDGAGPASNLLTGMLALVFYTATPRRAPLAKLFFLATGLFAWFWEGGYIVQAMATADGDAYFAMKFVFGISGPIARGAMIFVGVVIYALAMRIAARGLLSLRPDARAARRLARSLWIAAAAGSLAAALLFRGEGLKDLQGAAMEIALALAPLLFLPRGFENRRDEVGEAAPAIERRPLLIAFALAVFVLFAATLGRGVGTSLAGF